MNVEKFGYDYDVENAVEVVKAMNITLGDISIDPLPAKVELDVEREPSGWRMHTMKTPV